jgi:hypothetical protein
MPKPDLYLPITRPAVGIAGEEAAYPDEQADPPEMCDQLKREMRWTCEWWPPD